MLATDDTQPWNVLAAVAHPAPNAAEKEQSFVEVPDETRFPAEAEAVPLAEESAERGEVVPPLPAAEKDGCFTVSEDEEANGVKVTYSMIDDCLGRVLVYARMFGCRYV